MLDLIEETNTLLYEQSPISKIFHDAVSGPPAICQHCAHWDPPAHVAFTHGFCKRTWLGEDEESEGWVTDAGPRFGCVHWRAGE